MDDTVGISLLLASCFIRKKESFAILANNQYDATAIYEFLLNFLPEDDVAFFPSDELLRAESLSSSRELLAQRLYAMGQISQGGPKILVTHPSAVLRFLPNQKRFKEESILFKLGQAYDLSDLKRRLSELGYTKVNRIDGSLQFASRGDILDIYSVSYLNPIRIEFFGDEVESIKFFDLQSQQSKEEVKEALVLPATDIFLSEEELTSFSSKVRKRLEKDKETLGSAGDLLEQNVSNDLECFINRNYKNYLYKYYGLAAEGASSILDYFDPKLVVVANEEHFRSSSQNIIQEARSFYADEFYKARCLSRLEHYFSIDQVLGKRKDVVWVDQFVSKPGEYTFPIQRISVFGRSVNAFLLTLQSYLSTNEKVLLAVSDPRQKSTVTSMLEENGIEYEKVKGFDLPKGKLGLTDSPLNVGFEMPSLKLVCISSSELFGKKAVSSRFSSRFKNASILKSYEELKPGDYVVHESYGIGQYLDVKTMEVDGVHRDFLHIAYANNEYLYVPLEQFRLVRKYAGREGAAPKLSHLRSGDWSKKKAKIKERVNDLADRLLTLYGTRAKIEGYAFPQDDDLQRQFESEFPHELTPDQEKAVAEIKGDMEKPEVMDRLLCGDVGFGKTEVAFRAAFKAIDAGKQVALLCPTTLLARQHFEVACARFESFGVRVALVSRLVPAQKMKQIQEDLAEGKIDLVIGTHRLLGKEIVFKDLGLLIVDEEQRFGVMQKERIKELKQNVDVLTLSATPIPRTLQMSLVGIRPLSQINTAPSSRMPIQTYVTPYKEEIVDELISRELSRHGQVFYLYNKVATIYSVASKMAKRIPYANIGVIHGQMDREEAEETMEKFYDGELNVLVSTTIIENGIDIPNANMIIVEDADTFGLSQLYQIKGRVGRGDRIAYAYLMYKARKTLNENATKRLKAIEEFAELGSGYKIAQRDLMIRGAGDILGPEQAGFIDTVGLDLYLKMLNEAIEERKTGVVQKPPVAHKLFRLDAYIPNDYASKSDKVELYQELEEAQNEKEVLAFQRKVRDIYGKLPEEVLLLIQKKRIDLLAESEEFSSIDENEWTIDLTLSKSFTNLNGIGNELFNDLSAYLNCLRVTYYDKKLKISLKKEGDWLSTLEKVLKAIHRRYELRTANEKQLSL